MKIRMAEQKDIPMMTRLLYQVCDVHAQGRPDLFVSGGRKYTEQELEALLKDDSRPILAAADDDDKMVGYAFCVMQDHRSDTAMTDIITLYLDNLCVDEAHRGEHIGTALYKAVLEYAKERGCYNVTLNVWSCNPSAMRFYEAMGMSTQKICMEQIVGQSPEKDKP